MCQGPKLLILIVVLGVVAAVGIPPLLRMFQSDEEQVRALVTSTEAAFESGDLSGVLDGFADDYREGTHQWTRDQLTQGLRYLFFRWSQGQTRWRLTIDEDLVDVTLGEADTGAVRVVFPMSIDAGRGDPWSIRVTATVREIDGAFRFASSTYEVESGERPF